MNAITRNPATRSALSALLLLLAETAAAQDIPAAPAPDDENIVVTGTRIKLTDQSYANPVITISRQDLEQSGETNLTDFLVRIPGLVGSGTRGLLAGAGPDRFIGSVGLNLLDLRNLGPDRALVLVNGRRHVSALSGTSEVDINTIPTDLIERIDVLTGGQSAIYGADGVAGVVNFVLKRDFEGIKARGQAGISERGDAGQRSLALTAGTNFASGRGNVAIAYEYGREQRLAGCDRRYLCGENYTGFARNPDDPGDDPKLPDYLPQRDIRYYDSAREGAIDLDFDGLPELLGDGRPFLGGTFVPPFYQRGGSGTRNGDYLGDLLPSVERHVVNGLFSFAFSDSLRLFAEVKYARVKAFALSQPTFDVYNYLSIDNPFMPQSVRDQVIPGAASDSFGETLPDGIEMTRDNFDFGRRGSRVDRETVRGVVGLDGQVTDHLSYSLSYTFGQTKVRDRYVNNQITDRYYAAIDVVRDAAGNPVCRVKLEGASYVPYPTFNYSRAPLPATTFAPAECVPLNVFGEGVASPAALAFITADTLDRSRLTQHVASGYVTGDTGNAFELPGGPVSFVLGGEYRAEKSSFVPDGLAQLGLTFANALAVESGKYSVKEAFAELRVPVIADRDWVRELSFGAALRLSDYATIGRTTTWKADGLWSINYGVTLRGTYSEAVRAPNISELFAPGSQDFQLIDDPCDASRLNNGTSFREPNCIALLGALGVADPAHYTDLNSSSVGGINGGNRDLGEETAKTWTLGVVFQPDFIRGLNLSLDWYDIRLTNAINTPDPEQLAELCVDQPSLDNAFCRAITRAPGSGRITQFQRGPQNVSRFRTAGLDLGMDYTLRTAGAGVFNLRLVGGYLDRLGFVATPGAELDSDRGEIRAPKYQATFDLTWIKGPLTVNYGLAWFDLTQRYTLQERAGDPDITAPEYLAFKARWLHDLHASYLVDDRFKFFGGIRNLTDAKPALGSFYYPVDATGRYFYTGVEVTFDDLF